MSSLLFPLLNVSLLVAALVYYLRKPILEFVATRHVTLRSEVEGARTRLRHAQEKVEELSAKLQGVDAELAGIRQQGQRDVSDLKARILADSKKLAQTISQDAQLAAESAQRDFKRELLLEAGTKILARAEELLRDRLTGDDRARLTREFSNQLGGVR